MIGRRLGLVWAVAVAVAVGIGIGAATVGDPPTRCPMPGVANGFQLGPGFWSGGEPEGDEAFEALAALGVKTIVSVDGSPPDLKSAHRHGIRYIHVPIKYDGVTRDQAALLVAASRSSDGPIFVHCHHGKHRGPTAAAIMMMGNGDWDSGSATDWLREAGTDPLYRGLFAAVKDFRPLRPEELAEVDPEDLPEVAEVPDLVTSMVEIDERFDRLGRLADAKPVDPDPSGAEPEPAHEALMLAEEFREAARVAAVEVEDRAIDRRFADAEQAAGRLVDLLKSDESNGRWDESSRSALAAVSKSCSACHADHR